MVTKLHALLQHQTPTDRGTHISRGPGELECKSTVFYTTHNGSSFVHNTLLLAVSLGVRSCPPSDGAVLLAFKAALVQLRLLERHRLLQQLVRRQLRPAVPSRRPHQSPWRFSPIKLRRVSHRIYLAGNLQANSTLRHRRHGLGGARGRDTRLHLLLGFPSDLELNGNRMTGPIPPY